MPRSFRFDPPEPRADALARPRLLRTLVRRWEQPVISVTGGPGLGKTTLLAQVIAENRIAPRGEDVWVGLEPYDADADRLSRVIAAALDDNGRRGELQVVLDAEHPPEPEAVADALWHRAPSEACLVLDDVHLLSSGSTGAAWLTDLVAHLPANGHLVLASRTEPPVPLSRLATHGSLVRVGEDDLRFDDAELAAFAERRGIEPEHFASTGGWPAMAELAAKVDTQVTGAYLWEEVLAPLGTVRRHILAVLCDLGGADDALATAAIGAPVHLADALAGVPLVAHGGDGWHVAHALWRDAPTVALPEHERAEIRTRAAAHLVERGRFDDAFGLVEEIALWEEAPGVLRAACLAADTLDTGQLSRWLGASPEAVRASPAGQLATGLLKAYTAPMEAITPLQQASDRFREAGDIDAELTAFGQVGRLAWWWQDVELIRALSMRVFELDQTGHPKAGALAAFGWALVADMGGDDATVLKYLGRIEPGSLDRGWEILARWYEGLIRLYLGQPAATRVIVDNLATADPAMSYVVETLELMALWATGHVEAVLDRAPAVIEAGRASGVTYSLSLGMTTASLAYSHTGDVEAARACLEEGLAAAPPALAGDLSVHSALATASLQLAEGDDERATATLRKAFEQYGLDRGTDRRWWRQVLSLSYILLPESRPAWDALELRGHLATSRTLAAAAAALRTGGDATALRALDLPNLGVVRAALHVRFAAELAVGLTAAGRNEGRQLLDVLGPQGRAAVRTLAAATAVPGHSTRLARPAKSLLAAVPAPPQHPTHIALLGPLSLRRGGPDGEEVDDTDLRRLRLLELVAFLVGHRRTTRAVIASTLWPDLESRAAANNLGVTLNRLLRLLEPWRAKGEPAYLVRLEGHTVELLTGRHLTVDVDMFDAHVAAAARAELEGTPSLALEHHEAAVALYRDDLYFDLPDADWFSLEREHYRSRFVASAVRAGELLLGRGALDRAEEAANRALSVDRWSEAGYAVLVGAALARGDRSAARRILDLSVAMLGDLGAEPSPATEQLRRRVLGVAA